MTTYGVIIVALICAACLLVALTPSAAARVEIIAAVGAGALL
jgi:hypothetical protein